MPRTTERNTNFPSLAPEESLAALVDQPGTIWLDSGMGSGRWGEKSFLASQPVGEINLHNGRLTIRGNGQAKTRKGDIFGAFAELDKVAAIPSLYAIGYISYEATLPLIGLRSSVDDALPCLRFYVYDALAQVKASINIPEFNSGARDIAADERPVTCTWPKNDYLDRVAQVKEHIREGDIYQANFTCRYEVESDEHPVSVYRRLRQSSPAPYAAYANFGDYHILSASPERMLYRDGRLLTTSPIKGTIRRGSNAFEESRNTQLLLGSEKDRAEHLMIVDLERNDLGKIAEVGSVQVDSLYRPELYGPVIHLVSDISARVGVGMPISAILSALLPGGSITGAPKRRAVEIIQELEAAPRGIYTGCIGYIHGSVADFNIAIRTLVHQNGRYTASAGGGIVADSSPEAEYEEMLLKASSMFRALGIKKWEVTCLST